MWDVSNTYATILASDNHWFEYSVCIGNTLPDNGYREEDLISVSVSYKYYGKQHPEVGQCLSAELSVTMYKPETSIPRMAKIRPYVRATDGTNYSEWIPQGVFWIDTRTQTSNNDGRDILSITAYDSMLKTEADYPSTSHSWPYTDTDVVEEIADTIGVGVDDRTYNLMTNEYEIGAEAAVCSMREALSNIAAMYAGNWIMNYDGDLLLIAINGIPSETNYLTTAIGEPITFGGDYILV